MPGEDGLSSSFTKEQVRINLLFLAVEVNGEILPKEHGFPFRLVAEDILGGSWVKWVKSIEVERDPPARAASLTRTMSPRGARTPP